MAEARGPATDYDQRFVTHTIATIAVKATAALIGPDVGFVVSVTSHKAIVRTKQIRPIVFAARCM